MHEAAYVSDLVGNPEDRVSRNETHIQEGHFFIPITSRSFSKSVGIDVAHCS